MQDPKISKECLICHKVFRSYKCQKRQTCSYICKHQHYSQKLSQKITKRCQYCDNSFIVRPSRAKQQYCSHNCFHTDNPAKTKLCPICKSDMPDHKNKTTCSINCMLAYYSQVLEGANNPNWKGSFLSRENSGISATVRATVLKRDNHQYQDCGTSDWTGSPSLLHTHHVVHHINGGTKETNNLLTLCFVCHWIGRHKYELSKPLQKIASATGCGSKYF